MKKIILMGIIFVGGVSPKIHANCAKLTALLWDGQNPARVFSKKLESTFKTVTINRARIAAVVRALEIEKQKVEIPEWNYPPYLQTDDPIQLANFMLVLGSINFNFFDPFTGKPYQNGKDKEVGATLASKRVTEAWPQISNPDFLRNISPEYVREHLFKADSPISMVESRARVLREVGDFLYIRRKGGILQWFDELGTKEPGPMMASIPLVLPSWRDPFYKRSQLFLGILYGRFQKRADNPIAVASLGQLTIFADYRVPQTLRAMDIIELSQEAEEKIEAGKAVIPGSDLELELRAASILSGDLLVDEMNRVGAWSKITALEVDYLLWSIGRSLSKGIEMPGIIVRRPKEHHTITLDY